MKTMIQLPFNEMDEAIRVEPILQFFKWDHLPDILQDVSRPFGLLAFKVYVETPRNPERTVALRKLLESKDCAIRAMIYR
jgi:hypothetical protein